MILDPEFGIHNQIILGSNPSFACFSQHALSLSLVEALPHKIVVRWHEIIHVKSTLVIANTCSTLPGARSYSRAFHFILIQPEKEGVFFPTYFTYLIERLLWSIKYFMWLISALFALISVSQVLVFYAQDSAQCLPLPVGLFYFRIKVDTFISNLILIPSLSILSWILSLAYPHGTSILKTPR